MTETPDAGGVPRVLVVNLEPFTTRSATGLTLKSLFKGWPRERLASLYLSTVVPDRSMCAHTWYLDESNLPVVRAVRRLVGKPIAGTRAASPGEGGTPPALHWTDRSSIYQWLSAVVSSQYIADLSPYRVPPALMSEIASFGPQVIYTMLGANRVVQLSLDLARALRVRVVPHFMDDWPRTLYRRSVFRPLLRRRMRAGIRAILDDCRTALVIGDGMAREYRRRFGGEFAPFMNAVEADGFPAEPPVRLNGQPLTLVYIGGLHLGRWKSLLDVAGAVERLRREGPRVELHVYTQNLYADLASRLAGSPGVVVKGSLNPDEVAGVQRAADILLHVESFERRARAYTSLSVSTKIPEYMAAGRPILAYGPGEVASIAYVRESGCGLAVGSSGADELTAALRELATSAATRDRLGRRGREVARERHDADRQRAEFAGILRLAAAR